jgi:hypothetical protein
MTDGHEGFLDRLARRLRSELGVLYDTYWFQGLLLHQAHREEFEGVQRM